MANEYNLTGATLAEICKINTPAASLAAELDACKLGIANDKHHVGFKDKDASYFRTCGWDSSGQALLDNLAYVKARNAGDTAYRKLIGFDASNILKIGQDTDIAAVTFGTTAQQARLDSTGLTINNSSLSSISLLYLKNDSASQYASGMLQLESTELAQREYYVLSSDKLSAGADTGTSRIYMRNYTGGTTNWLDILMYTPDSDLKIFSGKHASRTYGNVLISNGNLGVGDTGPLNKLSVKGGIYAANQDGGVSVVGMNGDETRWEASFNLRSGADGIPRGALVWRTRDAAEAITIEKEAINFLSNGYVGIGRVATAPLDLYAATASMIIESSTGTNYADIEIKNTAGTLCMGLEQSTAGTLLHGSTTYAGVICHTGNYPLEFGTNDAKRLRIGHTAPIIEIGSPTTSDDSGTKWDSTYLKGVCRVGTYLSLFDYSGTVAASQMLFNAYTYASTGVIGANAQKRRKNYITAALEMNSSTGIGLFVGDAGAENGAIMWARHLQCFTGVTRFGGVLEEVIDVEFWGEDQKIAVFYGHLNTMEFYDHAGTALTWMSALSPNDGRLIFNNNKILNFGLNGNVSHVFDGTNYKINGLLPTFGTVVNDWYTDNSGYVRIKLS